MVAHLGAVQSQEYPLARWSIGQRTHGLREADVDGLLRDSRILRTHILRPTWHFVLPADIRWMMSLSAPRLATGMRRRMAQLGLDGGTVARALDVIGEGLAGGRRLTREQIGRLLAGHGIETDASRLAYITAHGELELVLVSGGLDGRQQTYALLDEIAPRRAGDGLARDEAVTELVRRYFRSHGPSAIPDFTWWSSLTVGDTRAALERLGNDLTVVEVGGLEYWMDASMADAQATDRDARRPAVQLLQAFDEYVVGYQRTRSVLDYEGVSGGGAWNPNTFINPVVADGQVVGGWRRSVKNDVLLIETKFLRALDPKERDALAAAAEGHAEFVGLPARLA